MCIFTRHNYLCLHYKIKLTHPCSDARVDAGGKLFCPHDPNPAHGDKASKYREYTSEQTYGYGVCASLQCHWTWSLVPIGHFGKAYLDLEDDGVIEMSEEAKAEREDRWYRNLLSTEQQWEVMGTTWPLPSHEAVDLLMIPDPKAISVKQLNPRYMDAQTLHWLVHTAMLPASLIAPPSALPERVSTLKPRVGPFAFPRHKCGDKPKLCRVCGTRVGLKTLRESSASWQETMAEIAAIYAKAKAKKKAREGGQAVPLGDEKVSTGMVDVQRPSGEMAQQSGASPPDWASSGGYALASQTQPMPQMRSQPATADDSDFMAAAAAAFGEAARAASAAELSSGDELVLNARYPSEKIDDMEIDFDC